MAPTLAPAAIGRELAACAALGTALGIVRAFFPQKGRGAVLPDGLWVGGMLLCVQSYAAGSSEGGVLRWYMLLGMFAAAGLAAAFFGSPVRTLERGLCTALAVPVRLVRRFVFCPVQKALAACADRRKKRRFEKRRKRAAKKAKKNLPSARRMLYNSNGLEYPDTEGL